MIIIIIILSLINYSYWDYSIINVIVVSNNIVTTTTTTNFKILTFLQQHLIYINYNNINSCYY